jgi:hypothetical protein
MDEDLWTVLDSGNRQALNVRSITKIIDGGGCGRFGQFYRYVRLMQTGKTSRRRNYLILTNHEFTESAQFANGRLALIYFFPIDRWCDRDKSTASAESPRHEIYFE